MWIRGIIIRWIMKWMTEHLLFFSSTNGMQGKVEGVWMKIR